MINASYFNGTVRTFRAVLSHSNMDWKSNDCLGRFGGSFLNIGGTYTSGSVPSPGSSLRGGKSSGAIRLNWSSVNGAGPYNVKRCNVGPAGCIPGTIVSTPTIPQYSEPDNPISYFYTVEAVNQCGATP
jgi:hypothetical protein